MERNPAGSYRALFVVAKGLSSKIEWSKKKKRTTAAIKSLVETISPWLQKDFMKSTQRTHTLQRELCRIYVGLSDEQAVYLSGMHQHSSMFQHEFTYREEVCQKCFYLNVF